LKKRTKKLLFLSRLPGAEQYHHKWRQPGDKIVRQNND
jgi:hypothetical protein